MNVNFSKNYLLRFFKFMTPEQATEKSDKQTKVHEFACSEAFMIKIAVLFLLFIYEIQHKVKSALTTAHLFK